MPKIYTPKITKKQDRALCDARTRLGKLDDRVRYLQGRLPQETIDQARQQIREIRTRIWDRQDEFEVQGILFPSTVNRKQTARRTRGTQTIQQRIDQATPRNLHYTLDVSSLSKEDARLVWLELNQSVISWNGKSLTIPYEPFHDQIQAVHNILTKYSPIPSFVRHQQF